MARKKSYESEDETAPESGAEVEAHGEEAPDKEGYTDTQIEAYQPCAAPPLNPPTPAAIAKSVADKAKEDERPEPDPEPEVEIQEDGMYRVGQDVNVKGRAFTKGESIFLEDDEVETLKALGVKLMPPDRDPHQMGPKARKAAGLDESPKGENPQY